MPEASPSTYSVTTINYTLEWPHLENPSNTTFAGLIQIDECKCGPNNTDLGHLYTRYRCVRPEIRFSPPGDELWVLQAPLGQVNLLRPANDEEHERRKEIYKDAKPTAYAGKNFLLLTGPCPRGRYQAYATLQFLKALSPAARQQVEYLSLLIQPYEEDCSDDQGGRAYIELAQYIRDKVPAFKTLCLNIWGEETRVGSREFGMLLLVEGISISISWDWCSAATDEYTDVSAFLKAIETGVVVNRLAFENMTLKNQQDDDDNGGSYQSHDTRKRSTSNALDRPSRGAQASRDAERSNIKWTEVLDYDEDEGNLQSGLVHIYTGYEDHPQCDETEVDHDAGINQEPVGDNILGLQQASSEDDWSDTMLTPHDATRTFRQAGSDDNGSDTMLTPLSPQDGDIGEYGSWQVL